MPVYEKASDSIAASTTLKNAISGESFERSPQNRTLQAVAGAVLDNSPANGDVDVVIYVGSVPVMEFRPGLVRSTGKELQAEDYLPVAIPIPAGQLLRVEATNNDAAAAHSLLYGLVLDTF